MRLISRVTGILLHPAAEWQAVEPEPGHVEALLPYALTLALIPAATTFVSMSVIGVEMWGGGASRLGAVDGFLCAAFTYVLTLALIYISAAVQNALARTFDGEKNFDQALKLAVYSNAPYCVASALTIMPMLGFAGILGLLYGVYLNRLGSPVLMKVPQERSLIYAAAVFIIVFLIGLPLGMLQMLFLP
ncbi:MAG TPA: Yip1 family protein [Parvibaculum sp.]|jgi:hypothetical protein